MALVGRCRGLRKPGLDGCSLDRTDVLGQMSAVETGQMSANVTMFKSQIVGLALNRRKWPEMSPEWSPGLENPPPGMPRPFPSLWDQSRGQKSTKKVKRWLVWGLALGLF